MQIKKKEVLLKEIIKILDDNKAKDIVTIDLAIAGGVEHMGNHPMGDGMDPNPRYLAEKLVDTDALSMGNTAERLHDKFPHLTKERADKYALRSQEKTAAAYKSGKIQPNLIPVAVRNAEQGWGVATVDEPPRPARSTSTSSGKWLINRVTRCFRC